MIKFSSRSLLMTASCLALSGFVFTSPALASIPSFSSTTPWQASESGSNCAVTGTFDNGFIMDMGGQNGALDVISVNFRQDIFNAGETYQTNMHVPGLITTTAQGRAIDRSTLGIPVSNKDQLFAAIKNARSLNLGVEGNEFNFNLRDFGSSITFLEMCQARAKPQTPIDFVAPAQDTNTVSSSPATVTAVERPQPRERYIDRLDSSMRTNDTNPVNLVKPPQNVVDGFKSTSAAPAGDTFANRPQAQRDKFIPMKADAPEAPSLSVPTAVVETPGVTTPPETKIIMDSVLIEDPQPRPTARPTSLIRSVTVDQTVNAPAAPVVEHPPVVVTEPQTVIAPVAPEPQPVAVSPRINASTDIAPEVVSAAFDNRPQANMRRDMSATWSAPSAAPIVLSPAAAPAPSALPSVEMVVETEVAPVYVPPTPTMELATPDVVFDETPGMAGTLSVAKIGDVLGDDLQPRPTARTRSIVRTSSVAVDAPQSIDVTPVPSAQTSVVMVEKPTVSAPEPYFEGSDIMSTNKSASIEADFTSFATTTSSSGDLELRQRMSELESKVASLKTENMQLESELDFAIEAGRSEKASISSSNWDLEKATMMQNEAERQVKRLGMQLQKERARHEQEKAELEAMLFDPAVTSQEQMAAMSALELELSEQEIKLLEQRRLYEERIRILESQLNN